MKIIVALTGSIAFLLGLSTTPARAVEPLVLYDNFNATFLAPERWLTGQGGGSAAHEFAREIEGRRLRLMDRAYGDATSDSGTRFSGTFLDFPDPDSVTAIRATLQVKQVEVTSCPGDVSGAGARIDGGFFNTGTPTPGTFLDDVHASIRVERLSSDTDRANILKVRSLVIHCTDVNCSAGTTLASEELGSIRTGQTIRLLLQWDQPNHQFIFQLNSNPPVLSPYSVPDMAPSGARVKHLFIANSVANCTASPRPVASMEVLFDDVFVNQSAVQ